MSDLKSKWQLLLNISNLLKFNGLNKNNEKNVCLTANVCWHH